MQIFAKISCILSRIGAVITFLRYLVIKKSASEPKKKRVTLYEEAFDKEPCLLYSD
jgi:hypothetical protein